MRGGAACSPRAATVAWKAPEGRAVPATAPGSGAGPALPVLPGSGGPTVVISSSGAPSPRDSQPITMLRPAVTAARAAGRTAVKSPSAEAAGPGAVIVRTCHHGPARRLLVATGDCPITYRAYQAGPHTRYRIGHSYLAAMGPATRDHLSGRRRQSSRSGGGPRLGGSCSALSRQLSGLRPAGGGSGSSRGGGGPSGCRAGRSTRPGSGWDGPAGTAPARHRGREPARCSPA